MPATVSIFSRDVLVSPGVDGAEGGSSGSSSGLNSNSSSNNNGTSTGGGEGQGAASAAAVESGEKALVVLTLGSPVVDSDTGNTVFSLSAAEQVCRDILGNIETQRILNKYQGRRRGDGVRQRLIRM